MPAALQRGSDGRRVQGDLRDDRDGVQHPVHQRLLVVRELQRNELPEVTFGGRLIRMALRPWLITVLACGAPCGCTLLVGTDERGVGAEHDAAIGDDTADTADVPDHPDDASDASDASALIEAEGCLCLTTESQCRSDCASALVSCSEPCHGGPKGDQCRLDCQNASKTCEDACKSACASCASGHGCDPSGC